jgi:hypothetical protein
LRMKFGRIASGHLRRLADGQIADVRLCAHPGLSARFVAISEADVPVAVSTG